MNEQLTLMRPPSRLRGVYYGRYIGRHISESDPFRGFLVDEYEVGERAAARLMVA